MKDSIDWDNLDQENPLKQVRAHVKTLEKELEELRTFKSTASAEARKRAATEHFKELGLTEKQADLYLKINGEGEVTADGVKAFATEYGFKSEAVAEEAEGEDAEQDETQGAFAPVSTLDAETPKGKVLDSAEWFKLYQENPAEALAIAKRGKVKLRNDPDNELRVVVATS